MHQKSEQLEVRVAEPCSYEGNMGTLIIQIEMRSISSSQPVPRQCWCGLKRKGFGMKVKSSTETIGSMLILHVLSENRLAAGQTDFY